MFRFTILLFGLVALPAAAQTVSSDLNGDGKPEHFTLIERDGNVDLQIENTGGGVVIARRIAWSGGIGQKPALELAPNGSVRLISMNDSIGRHRWHLSLTIAYRQGRYMVAGYTYDWRDTLDLEDSGTCDLNLLNGKGVLQKADGPKRPIRATMRAMPVTEFKDDHPIPPACGLE